MSIEEYSPSEIEIHSLGIGVINSEYLDLTTREYLVVGDISGTNELGLNIGELQTTTMRLTDIDKRNIKYSMIVNNSGIGLNTSRKKFDENFKDKNIYGIYIEKGDIFCDGTIMAKNIKLMNDDGTPYVFDITNPETIIQNLIESINSNSELSRFTQGWNSTIINSDATISKNNIFTESFVNINAGSTDTVNNLHPLNIISGPLTDNIDGIQVAIKNTALTQPYRYLEDDEEISVREASSLKIGIMGNSNISPAIISTTKDMPLEFHVSKFNQEINDVYKYNGNAIPIYNNASNYPSMTITKDGNISMGKDYVEEIRTSIEPKLHVCGDTLLDNIYMKDKFDTKKIKHLDDIFIRKLGLNFNANQIIPGRFDTGEYEFDNLTIHNTFETSNLIVKDIVQFDKPLNINEISINKLNIRETEDSSDIRAPIQFHNEVIVNNDITINNSGSLKINDHRVSALAINNIKVLINNEDGTFTTVDGDGFAADDIQDKIALYYAINSDSGFIIDNSNLSIYGNIGVGIQNDQTYGTNKISINNDDDDRINYEIGIYNQGELLSSIGHFKTSFGDNDESLIIKTENSGSTNMMHNIYFYAGKTNDDIKNGDNGQTIYPTLSILQNQSIGINTNEILDLENIKLNINGSLVAEDIYIKTGNTISKALFFVKNEINELSNISSYVITTPDSNNKFFINYNESDTSRNNFLEKNKTFNVNGGINVTSTNTLNEGYFENNMKLATFKILKNTQNIDIKTAYTNNNLLIGLDDLTSSSKSEYINTTISKPQLMLRNLSERNYNDTIIRLYKGKTNGDISNPKNKAKYSGIDFCDWEPITGLRDKERWYIYRNYDTTKQTIENYPGVFEIGYSDNQYHPTKSGLEMMYKRNNNTIAVRDEDINILNDAQNYYFIFNRPVNDTSIKLPTYTELIEHPTVKIYGDMQVTGTINCTDLKILNQSITVVNNSLEEPNIVNTENNTEIIENDIIITANKLINKTNSVINTDNNSSLENIINHADKLNTNNIFYYNNNNSLVSLTKQYNKYSHNSLDFSTVFIHDNDYFIVNKMKLTLESMGEIINTHEEIKEVNPSCLSIKNIQDAKLISFYNDENNSYINIGNNAINNNDDIENISLHIQNTSKYLLQLTNTNVDISPKINFQNKISDRISDFWIFDGPSKDKTFNIIYGNNEDTTNDVDNLYNVMTLTNDKKIGINKTKPLYSLDVLSENFSSCRLTNDYSNDIRNDFENETQFTIVNIENSNLNLETSLNILNNSNILFDLKIDIDSLYLPNYTINSGYIYDDIKNNDNYIKTNILYQKNEVDIPIIFTNEILNYEIDYKNIDSNIFEVTNEVVFNDITNNLELYNKLLLPSFGNSNFSNYEFKINENFLNNLELQSNILTNSFIFNILLKNEYNIINTSDKLFTSNITNYHTHFDTLYSTSNVHIEYTNYLYKDDILNATDEIYKINLVDKEIDNENYKIYFSNIIKYDKENLLNDTINIDFIVKDTYESDTTITLPYSIMNNDDIKYNIFYDHNLNNKNSYTYNFLTSNYLLNDIFGASIDNISTNTINYNSINQNKLINFNYEFNSQSYNINSNIDIEFKFYYEKYDINLHTHYLYTNIIENVPHIVLENTFNTSNSKLDGVNKIYSTLDGDFKINFETDNNDSKTLINLNKNGNVFIDSGNLYVDKIFVDNIYNKDTLNSIILNNTNNFNEETYINSFSNLKLEANSNIELSAKQIEFNVLGNNSSNIKIIKTGDYNNSNNKILEIYCNDDIDNKLYNTLSLSKINTTTYLTIGENSAKIGICKNIDEIESTLDINGNMLISKNNFDIKVPHITLNNYNQNLIYKKYNENLIYSDDGIFKLSLKNKVTQSEKELFRIDDNNMNVNSDNLLIKNIFVENIYDNTGKALVLGNSNYNNIDFLNFTYDLNLEASNIKFTTSNVDIALRENNNNYFNINKIRGKTIINILNENYQENNVVTLVDTNIYLYLFIDKTLDKIYIYNTNNKISKYENTIVDDFYEFGNSIDKFKFFHNNYDKLAIIKGNNLNILNITNFQNSEIKLKLPSNYQDNYPTNSSTIYIYDNVTDITTYNFNVTNSNDNYYFNELNSKLFLGVGTYYINNIPDEHPIGFVISDTSLFEVISGNVFNQDEKIINGIDMIYYTGDIIIQVKADFGTISYSCYYHGYMGGLDNLEFQSFSSINMLDIFIDSTTKTYIADNNNILKIDLAETDYTSGNELTANFISNNNLGNMDGILNKDAEIGIISSLVLNESANILYIADITNSTIRKINILDKTLETISGFVPTSFDNNPRFDKNTGHSYDTRFNNIKKILLINNNEFLLVLDSSTLNSRIVIIELESNYSSTLYEVDNIELYDIEFYNNNNIYYLDNNVNNILKNIEIINFELYRKNNITSQILNNIFNITSIPYDSINNEYYSASRYDYTDIDGFITNMSVKTKSEFTHIQFGSDTTGRNACIGISTQPDDNIDLKVNNKIQTYDLEVLNNLLANQLNINKLVVNNIDSLQSKIELSKDIYPINANINFGSDFNYYNNIFINKINISDNLNSGITLNSTGFDLFIKIKNDNTKYGNIHINELQLYDEFSETKSLITYNNSNLEFNFINNNSPNILHNFKYDFNNERLLLNNLRVDGELLLTTDFVNNNIYTSNIIVDDTVTTYEIYSSYIDVSEKICSSNIDCYSNLNVYNDINITNNLISSNEIHINSNLYVNQYSFINNLETSNIDILYGEVSNLIVHDTLYASNLIVQGNQTIIQTNHYETENLVINNTQADGASLEIIHNNNDYNVLDFSINDKQFILDKDCKLNLNDIEINNNIIFSGSINNISSNNLNNILNLDKNIIDKFQDSSNYTENIEFIANNSSNIIKDVDDKLNDFIDQDFFKENPLHPIIKEFDNSGNIINKYTYNNQNNKIFSTYDTSNFYIVLKNDTDDAQKHYQLSVTNNLLTDVMMVAGGGSGKNIDIDNQYDTNINSLITTSDILGISLSNDYLYYFRKNVYNSIYYSSLNDVNSENLLINNIDGNITSLKISKNNKYLCYIINKFLYINYLDNFNVNNVQYIEYSNNIIKIIIDNLNESIYLLLDNSSLIIINLETLVTKNINLDFICIDMDISNDDNYLYLLKNNKIEINIFNIKTETYSLYKSTNYNINKILIDKYYENFIIIDNDNNIVKHNIDTNSKQNIHDTGNIINIFDINNDNSLVYYLQNNNLYSKPLFNDVYPSPGGAGGLLYRNDATINQGVYDLYIGNGGINNTDGYNTIGFGVTLYGGEKGKLNNMNIPVSGNYKGYLVENNYIIKNNSYENMVYSSAIFNGGTSATNILENNYYDGKDGYNAGFLVNDKDSLNLNQYFSGGSGTYPGFKGKGGGTNSRDTFKLLKKDLIADNHSGAGASGGYNRMSSIYPKINNVYETTSQRIIDIDNMYINNILEVNIQFELPTTVEIIIYNNYKQTLTNEKYLQLDSIILEGEYNIVIDYDLTSQKYDICFKNKFDDTEIIFKYSTDNNTYQDLSSSHSDLNTTQHINIKLNNIEYNNTESHTVTNNKISYNDISKGGSGIIVMKYNIYKDPISNLQQIFDNRLKLLEENLLFSRINTYNNDNITIKFFKNENSLLYDNIYIDQSYSGIKLIDAKQISNNTVNIKYKYIIKLYAYIFDYYNDNIPNVISKLYRYETHNDIINFNEFISLTDKYIYIDKIEVDIYDNVYDFSNKSYYSNLIKNNNIITPSINNIMPLHKDKFIENDSLSYDNNYQLIDINNYTKYHVLWSSKIDDINSEEKLYPSQYARQNYFQKIDGNSPDEYNVSGSDYDNGIYTVEYSSKFYSTNNSAHYLFHNPHLNDTTDATTDATFASNQYSNGNYVGSNSLAGIDGDWVTIQMPNKILLTKYIIVSIHYATILNNRSRMPHKYKIFGCNNNDGNWEEIFSEDYSQYNAENIDEIFTNTYINNNDSRVKILSDTDRLTGFKKFNTFGLVVEKIGNWGGSSNINLLAMGHFEIYGREKLPYKRLPLNVFNNTNIYGEWKNNTYLDNGYLDSAYLDGRTIKVTETELYRGEWVLIMLDRKLQLNKIIIDIGADGTNFTSFKIFGKNISKNDENLIITSEIINTIFDNINYTYTLVNNNYIIDIQPTNYYNTILILFENIEENKNTLKIKNINFKAIYKNWEI